MWQRSGGSRWLYEASQPCPGSLPDPLPRCQFSMPVQLCATPISSAKEAVGLTPTLQIQKLTKDLSLLVKQDDQQPGCPFGTDPRINSNLVPMPGSPGASSSPAPHSNIQTHHQIIGLENQASISSTAKEAQQPIHLNSPCKEQTVTEKPGGGQHKPGIPIS